jgi:predicted ArsR family transcriptional regulator
MSKFSARSAREAVLAQVGCDCIMAKEIAGQAGVTFQTAIGHLWAAEAEGLIEMVEGQTEQGRKAYFWRRRNGR